ARAKSCLAGFNRDYLEFFDFDLDGLQVDFFLLTRKFVCGNAVNFLCRKRWWCLLDYAAEARCQWFQSLSRDSNTLHHRRRLAFTIVGVSREAEADCSFVAFF